MRKRITATKENRLFLAGVFGVTERCVFNALSGKTDSEMARKIRKAAMERGAREVSVYEDDEIIYDADGYLRQYFTNGCKYSLKSGPVSHSKMGHPRERTKLLK